ncbi:MAG: hypothetical protein JRJ86_16355 [Deltaproteobacteria bacterium]|nr:hypothetical protein [Deltaproteobacteria bacterium]MBW2118796.1 hypothetical protein [Deltaproteobacteria bacterium]MBW2345371.1 hypothetical protein [Deltaproteobacteria bacterium]
MKSFSNIVKIAVCIVFIWCVVSTVRPYWNKYWLGHEIRSAAIYGTKNSISDTRTFLVKKIKYDWPAFSRDDFFIEKDENDTVTVGIEYCDAISVFGVSLKELDFTVEKTVSEVDAIL